MSRTIRPAELVRRTYQAMNALYSAKATEGGLTLTQFSILDVLLRPGPQTAFDLNALTGIDRSTLFEMLSRLQKLKFIAQVVVESPKPGRNPMAMSLTPRGRRAHGKAETLVWNAEVKLMARLNPHQRADFLTALELTAYATLAK